MQKYAFQSLQVSWLARADCPNVLPARQPWAQDWRHGCHGAPTTPLTGCSTLRSWLVVCRLGYPDAIYPYVPCRSLRSWVVC